MRIAEVQEAIFYERQEIFGIEYHFSYGHAFAVKPWFVKKVGKTFASPYLEFDLVVEKLYSFLTSLRENHKLLV